MKSTTESGGTLATLRDSFRGRVVRNLLLLVAATTGAIIIVVLVKSKETVDDLSDRLLTRMSERVDARVHSFFDPVRVELETTRLQCDSLDIAPPEQARLNALLAPLLTSRSSVSSLLYANRSGEEFMLLQREDGWTNRRSFADSEQRAPRITTWTPEWERIDEQDFGDPSYDPRRRPWFETASGAPRDTVTWTSPYQFKTTKDVGITACIGFDHGGQEHVLGFDVMLRDLSEFTQSLSVHTNGRVAVLDGDGRVIGLPWDERYTDAAQVREDLLRPAPELGFAALTAAFDFVEDAKSQESEEPLRVFPVDVDGDTWRVALREHALEGSKPLQIVVLVPEDDLRKTIDNQRNWIIAIASVGLLAAFGLALWLNRSVRAQVDGAVARARRLGQYTLLGKIGQGGMGAVYHARHAMLRRPCAVKMLRPEQDGNETAIKRFEREVQATAELTHPNTISIYDYGRTPDGVFYYAMEYLRGISLLALVREDGPQPAERVIHILEQVCGSLAEAHERGLIHRDIKPGNIVLCGGESVRDLVKVLDFGLVKDAESTDGSMTKTGMLFGTPNYMSPEGILNVEDISPASDLYALGAVGYYLVTGSVPIRGETMVDVIANHVRVAPERPSARLGSAVPEDLEDVLLACLAKKPEERPASARELGRMLRTCRDAGKWTDVRAEAWWTSHADLLPDPDELQEGSEHSIAVDLGARQRG